MTQTVALPLWLFVILLLLAALAALEWLLLPSVRWYLRRKVDRVIREINVRFNIELPAFKLTRRRALIEHLFHDPKVQAAAEAHAAEKNVPLKLARQRADSTRARSCRRSTPISIFASATGWPSAARNFSTACASATPMPIRCARSIRSPPWCS